MHKQWKQGQVTWEEYRDTATGLCRDGVRKARAQLKLSFARGTKRNKRGFYRYINWKRKFQDKFSLSEQYKQARDNGQ